MNTEKTCFIFFHEKRVMTNKIACFYKLTIEFDGKMNVYFNKQQRNENEKLPTNENLLFYVIVLADY